MMVNEENEKIRLEICKRMQAIDDEMNIVLGMINGLAFPNGKRPQPICGLSLLKMAVSVKTKMSAFLVACKKANM